MPLEADLADDERWSFDDAVAAEFDDMLERSIPGYSTMRLLTDEVAVHHAQPGTTVVDLGCSLGRAIEGVARRVGDSCDYLGVEVSAPMRAGAEQVLAPVRRDTGADIQITDLDLRERYPSRRASVTLCVLTLQFTPIEHRQRILRDAYEATVPGGAFVLVEKCLGADAHTDRLLTDLYYGMKADNGYTEAEIARKRRSLEGVLVPVSERWNLDLLRHAGFDHIEPYWRTLQFAGWVATKAAR